ncbi:MAG TPA: TonB family protein [Bryobacteraceae bacterium]|nr:TonB family protein [Bryobacteraceae bacterium]
MSRAEYMPGLGFDPRDSMRGAFFWALALHLGIIGSLALQAWISGTTKAFGSKDAGGGSVAVTPVNSIPIPHHGEPNPLANPSESAVPQTPVKAPDRVKAETPSPKAIPIKTKKAKQKEAPVASARQIFRPYKELTQNQLTSKAAPQIASPMFTSLPGAGNISTGAHTTLGSRFAGYGAQIEQIVAQHWRTNDVDARYQTAPVVIATFDLMRDGTIRNVQLLQTSGILTLDNSVKRAILDSAPFPPIPPGFEKSYATVEFTFELKR